MESHWQLQRVAVLGLGYVGLPTAAILANSGLFVLGVDVNQDIVARVNRGEIHITEAGLAHEVAKAVASGRLTAAAEPEPADAFIICVPTPLRPDHTADLSYVLAGAHMIMPHLRPGALVVLESTVPPGTIEDYVIPILQRSGLEPAVEFSIAHCPERVLPGKVIEELVYNHRIIGANDLNSRQKASQLYQRFVRGSISLTDLRTAEFVKLVENTFRDVNIAFANELASICTRLGMDVWEVVALANRHPRVQILQPGPGVGGHCIAVDPWFIAEKLPDESRLIRAAREVNDGRPAQVVQQVMQAVADRPDPVVACLGLTYKANIDDLRESPALRVAYMLQAAGVRVRACEPHVERVPDIELFPLAEAILNADCIVLLVDHSEFVRPEALAMFRDLRGRSVMIDTRGVWRNLAAVPDEAAAGSES